MGTSSQGEGTSQQQKGRKSWWLEAELRSAETEATVSHRIKLLRGVGGFSVWLQTFHVNRALSAAIQLVAECLEQDFVCLLVV